MEFEVNARNLNLLANASFISGPIRHHLESVDNFYSKGVEQICTQTFKIEGVVTNTRSESGDNDSDITKIQYSVIISGVTLDKPKNSNYIPMMPVNARAQDLTYSGNLSINATITAIAHKKDGTTIRKTDEVNSLKIAAIPIMVRSKLCHTHNLSREALLEIDEDPTDPGGYFIIKGIEWVIINNESIMYNMVHVYRNVGHKNELARAELISKPGDAFENSQEIIVTLLNNNQLVCQIISYRFQRNATAFDIPFYAIFRALGITSDKKMIEQIIPFCDKSDVANMIRNILEASINCNYPQIPGIKNKYTSQETLLALGSLFDPVQQYIDPIRGIKGDGDIYENNCKYIIGTTLEAFDKNFLPHLGSAPGNRETKLRYFGHIINQLMLVYLQIVQSTDRDSYGMKRIHPSGVSYSKSFKTQFNKSFVQSVKNNLRTELQNTKFENVELKSAITRINSEKFEKALMQAITTSEGVVTISGQTQSNHLFAMQLHRNNPLNVYSTLRTITTTNTSTKNKANTRADYQRRVQPSYTGFICPVQSADTGLDVGMKKQMAISAMITRADVSQILKERVLQDRHLVTPLAEASPDFCYGKGKIMVNGDWIGVTADSVGFVKHYRDLRRKREINPMTTIYWNFTTNIIYLWVDVGRIIRPLLIVYSSEDPFPGDKVSSNFVQYIKITPDHLRDLASKKIGIPDLVEAGIVEYISAEEQQNCILAQSLDDLMLHKNNPLMKFTHCEISVSIVGLAALTSPYSPYNQLTRVCYQSNQVKQTCAWYAMNWRHRFDKGTFLQYHNELPLIQTMANNYISPSGSNVILALACYSGFNQEDSLLFNESALKRGLFLGSHFNTESTELDRNEEFGIPAESDTSDMKTGGNYEKLTPDGLIEKGSIINYGDCLIGKKLKTDDSKHPFTDKSVFYYGQEPGIVENVIPGRNQQATRIRKVVYRNVRTVSVGDKFCLSGDHMVFTQNGWIRITDLKNGTQVLSLIPETFATEYLPADLVCFDETELFNVSFGKYRLAQCTANHKFPIRGNSEEHSKILLVELRDLQNYPSYFLMSQKYKFAVSKIRITFAKTERVYCLTLPKNHIFYTRLAAEEHAIWTGNSSRAGQKGVCGMVYSQADMPFTESGLVPDIIMNPHGIPSRMTIGVLFEMLSARICAHRGATMDATVFNPVDIAEIQSELKKIGFDEHGEEYMYNGQTGEKMLVKIFIGPIYYQRLQKFVEDLKYAVSSGPTCALTHQPMGGRASQGGMRLGEMERDVCVSNGTVSFLQEKFFDHSDGYTIYVCKTCGSRDSVIVNERENLQICNRCGDLANIVQLPSSWSSKLLFQELRAMNIATRWNFKN